MGLGGGEAEPAAALEKCGPSHTFSPPTPQDISLKPTPRDILELLMTKKWVGACFTMTYIAYCYFQCMSNML